MNQDYLAYKKGGGIGEQFYEVQSIILQPKNYSKLDKSVKRLFEKFDNKELVIEKIQPNKPYNQAKVYIRSSGEKAPFNVILNPKHVQQYANGGGLADVPESFPETDAMSYKNGGSVKVGDKVMLPEIKMRDGKTQFEKVENGEVLSIENGIYDVLNPKTNRIHKVTLNQIKYKNGGSTKGFEYSIGGL